MTTQIIALSNLGGYVFLAVLAAIPIGLVVAIIYGARHWQMPRGKAITIIAGLLLLACAAYLLHAAAEFAKAPI
jgi:hypothetical protein